MQLRVQPTRLEQLSVCALLVKQSVMQEDDAICVLDRGEPMRDDERSAVFQQRICCRFDLCLDL